MRPAVAVLLSLFLFSTAAWAGHLMAVNDHLESAALAELSEGGLPPGAVAEVQAELAAQAVTMVPASERFASADTRAVPELSLEQVGQLQAFSHREWGLLVSCLLVGLVLVLRKVGARFLPWLGTERGVAVLALVGGTSTLLALALSQGQAFSFGLFISCLMGALSASGLWSVSKSLVKPKPTAGLVCGPDEIANGTCRV